LVAKILIFLEIKSSMNGGNLNCETFYITLIPKYDIPDCTHILNILF
jgi:hypothetical protein